MNQQHPTDLLPAYALDCLAADESERVRTHLALCATCREELSDLQEASATLMHAAPPAVPPDAIKARLMARIRSRAPYAWFARLLELWPRLVPATTVAAVALTVILGTANLVLLQRQPTAGSALARVQLVRLQATHQMPDASGVLLVDTTEGTGVLVVEALKELDRSLQYQLWLIRDGQRTSGGIFSVSSSGTARLAIVPPQPLATFDAVGITVEPFGGSPGPTGEKVLGGKLVL